ncbi:pilus assembly protein [Paenibacillus sp. CC-CFT747]|nr:pilus assembly protein [Paenibacillus sp. CC-CFT747]
MKLWWNNEKGSQSIELIGALPLFLLMIIIVWQCAMVASAALSAKAAAMEGARAAMVEGDYDRAARNMLGSYEVTSVSSSDVGSDYIQVSVTLNAPLLMSDKLFNTSGLSLPITSKVTLRKESKEEDE